MSASNAAFQLLAASPHSYLLVYFQLFAAAAVTSCVVAIFPRALGIVSIGAITYLLPYEALEAAIVGTVTFLTVRAQGALERRHARFAAQRWTIVTAWLMAFSALYLWRRSALGVPTLGWAIFDLWLGLRIFSIVWQFGVGRLPRLEIAAFATWIFLPYTWGGPFLPYAAFLAREKSRRAPEWRKLARASLRLVGGLAIAYFECAELRPRARMTGECFWLSFFSTPLYTYFFLSGAYEMMEALAATVGLRLPASFRSPFRQTNLAALWASWNCTATDFFREHFFFNRWGLRAFNLYVNLVLTFVIVGLWHVPNLDWLAWGFTTGVLFASYVAWQRHVAPRFPRLVRSAFYARAARVATYFLFGLSYYIPNKLFIILTKALP